MIIWLAFSLLFGHAQPLLSTLRWLLAVMLPFYLFAVQTGMRWKKGKVENLLCRIVEEVVNFRWNCGCVLETSRLSDWWEPHFLGQISLNVTVVAARLWWWWPPWPPWLDCTFPIDALGRKMGSDWDPSIIQSCFCHGKFEGRRGEAMTNVAFLSRKLWFLRWDVEDVFDQKIVTKIVLVLWKKVQYVMFCSNAL